MKPKESVIDENQDVELPGELEDDYFNDEPVNQFAEDFEDSDNPEPEIEPEEEENDEEEEELEEEEEEEEEPEKKDVHDPVRYHQSRADKAEAALRKMQEDYGDVAGIVNGLRQDPDAARLLMDRWSKAGGGNAPAEPELKAPTPPEDFDPALAFTPGTKEFQYLEDRQAYRDALAEQKFAKKAAEIADTKVRPFYESQAAVRAREQQLRLLGQTGLSPEQYDEFLSWTPPEDPDVLRVKALADAWKREKGIKEETGKKTQVKKKQFDRVNKNTNKPRPTAVKTQDEKPMSDSESYMTGLKQAAKRFAGAF